MDKLLSFSAKTFIVVTGTIVISAVAGYFTFYYKASNSVPPLLAPSEPVADLSNNAQLVDGHDEDTMLCLVCMEKPRTHIFIPCGTSTSVVPLTFRSYVDLCGSFTAIYEQRLSNLSQQRYVYHQGDARLGCA